MQDNALRYAPSAGHGHVESFFLRANHPRRPLAVWLKTTVLQPLAGAASAELWCIVFDGDRGRTLARRRRVPFDVARFTDAGPSIELLGARFVLGPEGVTNGALAADDEDSGCRWDLRFSAPEGPLTRALTLLPAPWLLSAPWPRFKLITPLPLLRFDGALHAWGETFEVDGWIGMQGHNWGKEHTHRYAWGQCHFVDAAGDPLCTVEAASARLKVAGAQSPPLSLMVIRRGEREYRFDRLLTAWRPRATISALSFSLEVSGRDGRASLHMQAPAERFVQLGYENPNGQLSYCLNSKLATTRLRVDPVNEPSFGCSSDFGGALEFLAPTPFPQHEVVV